jgi:polysaccharide export outer membrane protein
MFVRGRLLLLAVCLSLFPSAAVAQSSATADDARADPSLVRPGDHIRIRAWVATDTLGGEFFIDELGQAVLPRIGTVTVGGMGSAEAKDSLRSRYDRVFRDGYVEVTLLRRIGVHGEVQEPTLYWVDPTVTLREAVALAGGVTDEGKDDRVVLVRGSERLEIDTDGAAPMESMALRSGDQIIVPRRSWASLNAPYLISTGVTLISVLAGFLLSGG